MEQYYSDERNVQILISLLKQHGIKRIVASPGSTNVCFVGSVQQDDYFDLISCIDERSAAYMACGIAAETKEPVVLSCTGATASRNYFPALTEAYYRKLPVLAITASQDLSRLNHLIPQIIDRSIQPCDTVKMSVHLQNVKDASDEWDCMIKINRAILELSHHGFGPVHINLSTLYSKDFSVKEIPLAHKIDRKTIGEELPQITHKKIGIYIGSHNRWEEKDVVAIEKFCEAYNATIFVDVTSNYKGKYKVQYSLYAAQHTTKPNLNIDLLIHIGNMSDMAYMVGRPKEVWRVCEDGEISDRFQSLSYVFEMNEYSFFDYYSRSKESSECTYYQSCLAESQRIWNNLPDLPFSHLWVVSQLHDKFPIGSTLHLGILSPLRSWNYFEIDDSVEVYCNQGGFGIDGNLSSMIGASIASPDKLFFGIVGDLSFFYDLNSIGNRHLGPNVRILLVNNNLGAEFHLFKQLNCINVNEIEKNISAGGHYPNKSHQLVQHFVEDLGFEYISASNKQEFYKNYKEFVSNENAEKPILFEIFTHVDDENQALWNMWHIEEQKEKSGAKDILKEKVKNVIGRNTINKM